MEKLKITVSEPWDFQSEDGKNLIKGIIIERVNEYCILFKSNYVLTFGQLSGNILKLTPRFKGDNLLNLEKDVIINGGLLNKKNSNNNPIDISDENFSFVLIGNIKDESK